MHRLILAISVLMLSLPALADTVEKLRMSTNQDNTRLVLDMDRLSAYDSFTLENPDRLVIDIANSQPNPKLGLPDLKNSPIKNIRQGAQPDQQLRLVIDLKTAVSYQIQTLAPSESFPGHRLVIDMQSGTPEAATETEKTQLADVEQVAKLSKSRPEKTREKGVERDIVIAIDAGHGGHDPGAIGRAGTREKDVVLAIAKRLARLVEEEPGMRPYLTRDSDEFVSLRGRIVRARENNADMFISIHADAFHNINARGSSVYVLSDRGASSEAAQILADRENAADLAGGISLEDKDDLLASVLLDLSQTASLEASLEVGETVLQGLKRVGNVHKKQVESAAFVVLKSPDIPSVLVETAFISNPNEERKLNQAEHQSRLAHAMMNGIRDYFERYPIGPDNGGDDSPRQYIVKRGDTLSTIAQRHQVQMAELKSRNDLDRDMVRVGEVLRIP